MVGLRKDTRAAGYRRVVAVASIGTCIEIYDLIIYGYLATVLARQFFPPGDPVAALLATFAIFAVAPSCARSARSSSATSATGTAGRPRCTSRCC